MPEHSRPLCAVVLAAGEGKRMKSNRPKVLSEVLFQPMLRWVMDAALSAGLRQLCVVTGFAHEQVEDYLAEVCREGLDFTLSLALQTERRGTAHAVQMAEGFLRGQTGGHVLILNGDAPFLRPAVIQDALRQHEQQGNAVTVIAAELEQPFGYGRIVRSPQDGTLCAIVEEKDADAPTRALREVNSGAYWFRVEDLLSVLHQIGNDNAQGEYYLPDAIALLLEQGKRADAFVTDDANAVLGANDCLQLNQLNAIARQQLLEQHLAAGVEIPCLDGVMIGPKVTIGAHTRLLPGTILRGETHIGHGCCIGAYTQLDNVTVADGVAVPCVCAQNCTISENPAPFTALGQPAPSHPTR